MVLDTSVVDVTVEEFVVVVVDVVVVVEVVNGVGSVLVSLSLSLFSLRPIMLVPDVCDGVGTSLLFLVGVKTFRLVPDDCGEVGTLPELTNILGASVAPPLL